MFYDDLKDALLDNATLAAVIGTRIYHGPLPLNTTQPAITYSDHELTRVYIDGGHQRDTRHELHFRTWADTPFAAADLATKLATALESLTSYFAIIENDTNDLNPDTAQHYRTVKAIVTEEALSATAYACTLALQAATLNLNNGTTYRLRSGYLPSPIFHLPTQSVDTILPLPMPAAIFHGYQNRPREITLGLRILGANPSAIATNLAALTAALGTETRTAARSRATLTFSTDNGTSRAIKGTIAAIDESPPWPRRFSNISTRCHLTITIYCQDPTWYNPTPVAISSAFNDATPVTVSLTNNGNEDTPLVLRISGAIQDPKLTDANGTVFELDLTVSAGGQVDYNFDMLDYAVTHTPSGGSATDVRNLQTTASRIPIVAPPGTNNLTIEAASGTATLTGYLYHRYTGHGQ